VDDGIYERNKIKAKKCLGCIYLHIGHGVDHNHCDIRNIYRSTHEYLEDRANGHGHDLKKIKNGWREGIFTECLYRKENIKSE